MVADIFKRFTQEASSAFTRAEQRAAGTAPEQGSAAQATTEAAVPSEPDVPVEPAEPAIEPTDPDEPLEPLEPVEPPAPAEPTPPFEPVEPTPPGEPGPGEPLVPTGAPEDFTAEDFAADQLQPPR